MDKSFLNKVEEIKKKIEESSYNTLVKIYNTSSDDKKVKFNSFNKIEFEEFVEKLGIILNPFKMNLAINFTPLYSALAAFTLLYIMAGLFLDGSFLEAVKNFFGILFSVLVISSFFLLIGEKENRLINALTAYTYFLYLITSGLVVVLFQKLIN